MRGKIMTALLGAALCAGTLASPAHAAPEAPFLMALEMPGRAGIGWDVSINIHAKYALVAACDRCVVDVEFRAEGTKNWKMVRRTTIARDGFATTKVKIKKDGHWRARSVNGKYRSKAYSLDAGHASAVKFTRLAKKPRPGATVKLSGTAISKIGEKWRGIKGRKVCLYGAGQKKITCTTTGPRGRFTVKVKASKRGLVFRSFGTDTYMPGGSVWFWLIRA